MGTSPWLMSRSITYLRTSDRRSQVHLAFLTLARMALLSVFMMGVVDQQPDCHINGFVSKQNSMFADVLKKAYEATEDGFFSIFTKQWPVKPQILAISL